MTKPSEWVQERLEQSPVRRLREEQYPDRSVLCKKLGINDSVIYMAELVCYPRLPKTLELSLTLPEQFDLIYREFQKSERKRFGFIFGLDELTRLKLEDTGGESPLYMLCQETGLSRADLGKGLCIQPSVLYRLERGAAKSLGDETLVALHQAGVQAEVITFLNEKQKLYAA